MTPAVERLALEFLNAARARAVMVATAESCTGGLVAGAITGVAGSSDVFDRGFVTYSNRSKTDLLGVAPALLASHGAVSEAVACAMADGALVTSAASASIAITGVAGPGESEAKPEGLVWFATAIPGDNRAERRDFGPIGRAAVRAASVEVALTLLRQAVERLP